jgi:hypothetical protein
MLFEAQLAGLRKQRVENIRHVKEFYRRAPLPRESAAGGVDRPLLTPEPI